MDVSQILHQGGPVAVLIICCGLALYYALTGLAEFLRARAASRGAQQVVEAIDAPVDSAALTKMYKDALDDANKRLDDAYERIEEVETENRQLRADFYNQQRAYETEIGELRSQLQSITLRLEALQANLHIGP